MYINHTKMNRTLTFYPQGVLDRHTLNVFHSGITSEDFTNITEVVIDFSGLSYISAQGLRELLVLRKWIGAEKSFRIVNARKPVMDVLKTAGLFTILDISGSDEEITAIAAETKPGCEGYIPPQFADLSYKALLHKQTQINPDRIFIQEEDTYTFAQLDQCAQIVAMDLYELGVRKGSHVAICSANSANWIITFFAIQKLGAIALLANPHLTERELVNLSRIGDIEFFCGGEIVHSADNRVLFDNLRANENCKIVQTYDICKTIRFKERLAEYEQVKDLFAEPVGASEPAVMLFTSGTTGQPKGVLHASYSLVNNACAVVESLQMTHEDIACLVVPLFHVLGLTSLMITSLLAGSKLLIPENIRTGTIITALEQGRCTIMNAVPTLLLAIVANKDFTSEKVQTLRVCATGGSPISEVQMAMLHEKFPNTHFMVTYGLSEFAPVTFSEYNDTTKHVLETVGKPMDNMDVRISNAAGPDGSGEIMVRGYGLMTCYYKLPLDEQSTDEDGWLYTGDLGYFDDEGYLRITGRLKELIIRGGEKISPNAVAAAISEHKSIADVKVLGVPDSFYGESIAAAILVKQDAVFCEEDMRVFLKSKIAKYKIPAYFVVYEVFPTLPNGKVDAITLKQDLISKLTLK